MNFFLDVCQNSPPSWSISPQKTRALADNSMCVSICLRLSELSASIGESYLGLACLRCDCKTGNFLYFFPFFFSKHWCIKWRYRLKNVYFWLKESFFKDGGRSIFRRKKINFSSFFLFVNLCNLMKWSSLIFVSWAKFSQHAKFDFVKPAEEIRRLHFRLQS